MSRFGVLQKSEEIPVKRMGTGTEILASDDVILSIFLYILAAVAGIFESYTVWHHV